MSFIQRFLERVLRNNPTRMPRTSFDDLSQEQLDAHLRVGRYGNFSLTEAVRPSIGFDVIMDLLDPLGEVVDVVMESSHDSEPGSHSDMYREHMDTVILKSTLYDYESLLL